MIKNRWLVIGALGFAMTGCGGGGGTPSSAVDPLTAGRSTLQNMVSGQKQASAQNLQTAWSYFQQALQKNSGSSEARFGAAICLAGKVASEIDGTYASGVGSGGGSGSSGSGSAGPGSTGGSSGSTGMPPIPVDSGVVSSGPIPPVPGGDPGGAQPAPPVHELGLFWELGLGISNPDMLLNALAPVADLRYGLMPYYGYTSDDVPTRQQILTDLNTVDQNLQLVEADPNFAETLPDPTGAAGTVTVGLPEVYLFHSYVNSLRAEVALSLAYIRDLPSNSQGGTVGAISAVIASGSISSGGGTITSPSPFTDKNRDGKLEPDEYLPPSPFLTLRAAGLMTTTQQALLAEADDETKGINGVFARPSNGGGGFLITNSSTNHQSLSKILTDYVPLIRRSATGAVTIQLPQYLGVEPVSNAKKSVSLQTGTFPVFPEDTFATSDPGIITILPQQVTLVSITFNLAAWFANPPADLKVFAPTYPLDWSGYPILDKATYPDPTFAGLFPNGLPQTFLF